MSIFFTLLIAILAAIIGFLLGSLRSQREAIVARSQLEATQKYTEEMLRTQVATLRTEFKTISSDTMRIQGEALRNQHVHTLEELLKPLENDIDKFRTQYVAGNASLGGYIDKLVTQTATLGKEADNLAKALKSENKTQGNWGEVVLANLLSASGLTEGRDYSLQSRNINENGSVLIPDVIVHLPDNRNVIIDSKVSLKAYTDYVASDDTLTQDRLLKEHIRSVRQHVKELASKEYGKAVPHSIGYVLMFIPCEGAYVAAVNADNQLTINAYTQHVIIINPTNLLMALQLAYNLWQSELQSQSVREIFNSAERIYKKFCTFAQNFVKIGTSITKLQQTYNEAQAQLSEGKGNIVSQLENWRKKGLSSPISIPSELSDREKQND